ncbi:Uncharacterised protein [Bacteroides xylanisolvens]|nr:Uncharacterised protein [Bacteroides xylanisolvens]
MGSTGDNGFRVRPLGVLPFAPLRKRSCRFYGFSGEGAALFVILSGEKRRMLKNGLSKA